MRIALLGDVHLSTTPRHRIDDYTSAIYNKLQWLATHNDAIIITGDLFERPTFSTFQQLYRLVFFLTQHKGKFYTVIGNHDIFNANHSTIPRTNIGFLERLGLITIIREPIEFEGLTVSGAHYQLPIEWPSNKGRWKNSMLVAHAWYQDCSMEPEVTLTEQLAQLLKYEYYLLGHDHEPRKEKKVGKNRILRPGSVCRYYAHQYNLKRRPQFIQMEVNAMGVQSYEYKDIEVAEDPEVVFDPIVFQSGDNNVLGALDNISALLDQYKQMAATSGEKKFTVASALGQLKAPPHVVTYINQFLPDKEKVACEQVPTL